MHIFRWVPSTMMKSDKYQTKYNYETTEHPQMSACFYSRKRFHYLPFICFHFIFLLCIQPLFVFTKALFWRCEYFNQAWLLYILIQTQSKDRILSYFQSCLKKSTLYGHSIFIYSWKGDVQTIYDVEVCTCSYNQLWPKDQK